MTALFNIVIPEPQRRLRTPRSITYRKVKNPGTAEPIDILQSQLKDEPTHSAHGALGVKNQACPLTPPLL